MAKEKFGVKCELIDLRTIVPWDIETIEKVFHRQIIVHNTFMFYVSGNLVAHVFGAPGVLPLALLNEHLTTAEY
jgi:pyruvate/2-oxoglutarate/acetoin dehydrogenase E1 component